MTKNEILKEVKILFGMEKKEEVFAETKLQDGTIVTIDELKTGSKFLLKQDGETSIPAPKGEYILEDGKTLVIVNEDGVINEVKEVEDVPVEEVPTEEMPVEEVPTEDVPEEEMPEEDVPAEEQTIETLNERIKKLEEVIAELMKNFTIEKQELETEKENFKLQKEQFEIETKLPGGKPIFLGAEKETFSAKEKQKRNIDDLISFRKGLK